MLNPDHIKITPEILKQLTEIDEFKGSWGALEKHTTALQLLGDVANFGQNFKAVLEPWQEQPFSEDVIKKLHGVISGKKEGQYKATNFPLIIQRGEEIIGTLDVATPEDAEALMGKLVEWADEAFEAKDVHPLLVIALFMAVFLQLSPFEKGNQRLARMLIVLLMFKAGYSYAPYSALEPAMNAKMRNYFDALSYTQETLEAGQPDWGPWLRFFFGLLKDQKDQLAVRMEKGGDTIADMPKLSTKVLKLFENHERLSMKEIERLSRGRRSTLKLRLGELVSGGYLMRHGRARATWYARV
ncbi:MAG: hypothetical protein DHS20C02_12150 [Micavibrio sp.]|nr:MAG: hypothetical protein DHS20C02_12150 [Micavibrio sp.]